jgi:protein-L-isoaspartate O-methyltransferase
MMVIPLCENEEHQTMLRLTKQEDGTLKREEHGDFRFVPMLKGVGED